MPCRVTKLSDREYAVELEMIAVPALACSPAMQRDFQLGTTIDIPASSGFTYATVHFYGRQPSVATAVVKATAAHGVTVEANASEGKFVETTFMNYAGKNLAVDIDKKTIRGCFSKVGYFPTKIQGTTDDFIVKIDHLMVPAVMCAPSMMRDIDVGLTLKVDGKNGFTWIRVIVMGSASGDAKLKASLRPN